MVDRSTVRREVSVGREVGTKGLGGHQFRASRTWRIDDSVIRWRNLTGQVRNMLKSLRWARCDLSRKITVEVKGEILEPRTP